MGHLQHIHQKIYSDAKPLLKTIEEWKKKGNKIVFTNGCFDLVHRGHIDYLAKAADKGTKFIIGLNSDKSVQLLKGPTRPLVPEESRAILLAALTFVDAVVYFSEETPYDLIKLLLPDVLIKGNDYAIEEIAGFDVVLENGGTVETITLTDGFSTSSLIEKIKKQ